MRSEAMEIPIQPKKFKKGQLVFVERGNAGSGNFETGWEVKDFGIGVVEIIQPDKKLTKIVPLEDLETWNNERTFLPGQTVAYTEPGDTIPWPGWVVKNVDAKSGTVTIYNETVDQELKVSPEELVKDYSNKNQHYTR